MGKLKEEVNAPVPKVQTATSAALHELNLPIIQTKGDTLTAHVESEFSDGKHVWIDIERTSETTTTLTIRVGMMGDESRSRSILEKIKRRL